MNPDDQFTKFTEEALKANDGRKVPLTWEIGGPIIGEATLKYDPGIGVMMADMRINDPKVAELLGENASAVIFKKES